MSLVGLDPFLRERKGLFADYRRHGDRDPIPSRLLVAGAVARQRLVLRSKVTLAKGAARFTSVSSPADRYA
jgi:hypothetical protein